MFLMGITPIYYMINRFPLIEKYLGLHQEVSIIYVVDGYEAILYKVDSCWEKIAESGSHPSIYEALYKLEFILSTIEDENNP